MTEAAIRLQKRIAQGLGLGNQEEKGNWDPELLYAECMLCGRPILWKPGVTTALLRESGVRPEQLDESCLILSKGCPACSKGEHVFETKVVRLTNTGKPAGGLRDASGWS